MSPKRLKLNGRGTDTTASSAFMNPRLLPPLATPASMKLYLAVAKFVLAAAVVTLKTGPVTDLANTVTVIGPEVTPYGTIAVITFEVAPMTRAETPLNMTATFCKSESKLSPSIVTTVVGGPLNGVTRVMI